MFLVLGTSTLTVRGVLWRYPSENPGESWYINETEAKLFLWDRRESVQSPDPTQALIHLLWNSLAIEIWFIRVIKIKRTYLLTLNLKFDTRSKDLSSLWLFNTWPLSSISGRGRHKHYSLSSLLFTGFHPWMAKTDQEVEYLVPWLSLEGASFTYDFCYWGPLSTWFSLQDLEQNSLCF